MGCINSPSDPHINVVVINECSLSESLQNYNYKGGSENNQNLSFAIGNELVSTKALDLHSNSISSRYKFPGTALLKSINKARSDPKSLIPKIEKLKKSIVKIKDCLFLSLSPEENSFDTKKNAEDINNNINIKLFKGEESFNNCIEYLNNITNENNQIPPLIMKDELKLPFPVNSPSSCTSRDYLRNIIIFKKEEVGSNVNILDFHYDISTSNPELSLLIQVIDDTNDNYRRRHNIFNPNAKFVGISEGKIGKIMTCYYLMFGN